MKPECFLDSAIMEKWFADRDFHTIYIAEIEEVLVQS